MSPSSGDVFGPYRLDTPIGRGGLAEVWRATDSRNGAVVAVKLFTTALDKAGSERVRAEAELLAANAIGPHPHVVRVLDGGPDPVPWVVMEYVPGTDLAAELARTGRLDAPGTLRIGVAIAQALAAAAAVGIVHRDLKP